MIICIINNAIIAKNNSNPKKRSKSNLKNIPYLEPIMMIQTILLIPNIYIQISKETISYFRGMGHVLLSFSFISDKLLDPDRNNTYLSLIGIKYKEYWKNLLILLIVICIIVLVLVLLAIKRSKCHFQYWEILREIVRSNVLHKFVVLGYNYLLVISILGLIEIFEANSLLSVILSVIFSVIGLLI